MKMLLAVDGSKNSLSAVRHALGLVAQGLRASFVLANVQTPPNLYEVVTAHDPAVLRAMRGAAGADLLAAAEVLLDAAGVDYESEVAGGEPAQRLVELAQNYGCDALVLGAGQTVALAVVASSPVPVTVVPGPPSADT